MFFINENIVGNVEGERCGLEKMWILPKNVHLKILNARGSPPIWRKEIGPDEGRMSSCSSSDLDDCTFFENDEYLINVPQDVMIFNFSAPINENASMWITSGGGIIYAYKNESDTLLFFTAGTDYKMIDKTYRRCGIPDQMVQGGNIISMTKPGDYDASLPYSRP